MLVLTLSRQYTGVSAQGFLRLGSGNSELANYQIYFFTPNMQLTPLKLTPREKPKFRYHSKIS